MSAEFDKLVKLARFLRSKKGCPWDREQTLASLSKSVEEESQELIAAIQKKDHPNLKEEIGDLLFNLIMLSQIAEEQKLFKLKDTLKDIEQKILSRHTWVFGKDKAKTAEEAIAIWKRNKQKHRLAKK